MKYQRVIGRGIFLLIAISTGLAEDLAPKKPEAAPLSQLHQKYASVEDAQAVALNLYAFLGVEGSEINRRFVATVIELKSANSPVLEKNDWPMEIAEQVANRMRASGVTEHRTPGGGIVVKKLPEKKLPQKGVEEQPARWGKKP